MSRNQTRIYGPNRFKLGFFSQNCSGGLTQTKAPEYWDASWENNVTSSRLADEAGLEFLLPVARWLGYGGEIDAEGENFETLSWATGMLAATEAITVFGTIHVALINPVFAAKQMVTADHVGQGRFGLNMVSGWNVGEHSMFGIDIREHDERYAYTEEWATIVTRLWLEDEPFDFKGKGEAYSLAIEQRDVHNDWLIILNGSEVGRLRKDVATQIVRVAVPKGVLKAGSNELVIRPPSGKSTDDIQVGRVKLVAGHPASTLIHSLEVIREDVKKVASQRKGK